MRAPTLPHSDLWDASVGDRDEWRLPVRIHDESDRVLAINLVYVAFTRRDDFSIAGTKTPAPLTT